MTQLNKNSHGLSRYIDKETSFEIRKKYGFGCIICGSGIIEYDHVDPEFVEAKTHDPNFITLLCPTCHAKKTRNFLSIDSIKEALKNPKCLQTGFSKEVLDIGNGSPIFIFGGSRFSNCPTPLVVSGIPIIQFSPPEIAGAPFRLNAVFFDSNGNQSLKINNNEWHASTANWDIEVTGGRIIIKESKDLIHLTLKTIDAKTVEIENLKMTIGTKRVEGDKDKISLFNSTTGVMTLRFSNIIANNAIIGLSL